MYTLYQRHCHQTMPFICHNFFFQCPSANLGQVTSFICQRFRIWYNCMGLGFNLIDVLKANVYSMQCIPTKLYLLLLFVSVNQTPRAVVPSDPTLINPRYDSLLPSLTLWWHSSTLQCPAELTSPVWLPSHIWLPSNVSANKVAALSHQSGQPHLGWRLLLEMYFNSFPWDIFYYISLRYILSYFIEIHFDIFPWNIFQYISHQPGHHHLFIYQLGKKIDKY